MVTLNKMRGLNEYNKMVSNTRNYGIEIEVENMREEPCELYCARSSFIVEGDGSLRNRGAEFKTLPVCFDTLVNCIGEFYQDFTNYGWVANKRTGIHVHVDCRDLNKEEILNIIVCYILVEPILFRYCGQDREHCSYCVPWYRARDQVKLVKRFLNCKGPRQFQTIVRESCKYSALYIEPLKRFGTLEFRQAPTFTTFKSCETWVGIIKNLVDFALSIDGHAFEIYNSRSPEHFLKAILGSNYYILGKLVPEGFTSIMDKWAVDELAEQLYEPSDGNWDMILSNKNLTNGMATLY